MSEAWWLLMWLGGFVLAAAVMLLGGGQWAVLGAAIAGMFLGLSVWFRMFGK